MGFGWWDREEREKQTRRAAKWETGSIHTGVLKLERTHLLHSSQALGIMLSSLINIAFYHHTASKVGSIILILLMKNLRQVLGTRNPIRKLEQKVSKEQQ